MAKIGILASGSGSNFQAIVEALSGNPNHRVQILICDKPQAGVFDRASKLSVPSKLVLYEKGQREIAEGQIHQVLTSESIDLVVLAGFMRILSPDFVIKWKGRMLNIHPSLLPKFPGAHGIRDSFQSQDPELGVTVHLVDEGVDTGQVLAQRSFKRLEGMTLDQVEDQIHKIEHELYPQVILRFLNKEFNLL